MKNMKYLICYLLSFTFLSCYCQSTLINKFNAETSQFNGSKLQQAKLLLRPVKLLGIIQQNELDHLPGFLEGILNDSIKLPDVGKLKTYLGHKNIKAEEIGGDILSPISKKSKGITARYFVLHDISFPEFKSGRFPQEINSDTWSFNNTKQSFHKTNMNDVKAHIFIGRTVNSYSQIGLHTPWRATKFELFFLDKRISKGLLIHAELVQPRTFGVKAKWAYIAPDPGFTVSQYQKLALIYICASIRGEKLVSTCISQGFG
jgi:hypothetical protein